MFTAARLWNETVYGLIRMPRMPKGTGTSSVLTVFASGVFGYTLASLSPLAHFYGLFGISWIAVSFGVELSIMVALMFAFAQMLFFDGKMRPKVQPVDVCAAGVQVIATPLAILAIVVVVMFFCVGLLWFGLKKLCSGR